MTVISGSVKTIVAADVNTGDGGGFSMANLTVSRKEPGSVDLHLHFGGASLEHTPHIVVRLSLSAAEDLQSILAGGGESVVEA